MSQLSRPSTRFIGRDSELTQLEALSREGARMITLWGPPGVGKTRLALEFAATQGERYPGGVWIVSLSE
ncbi:MAG: ATP-binding protein, partial [Myxococcota bacterium]